MMVKLGVNVDHIATLRQARQGLLPSPLRAAEAAVRAGADGITVHLRKDRRHIQESDVEEIKKNVRVPLNLEMAVAESVVRFALQVRPEKACLVPEHRAELTTEGGLNVRGELSRIREVVERLTKADVEVSLFIDPDPDQIKAVHETGARWIELHTGAYANAHGNKQEDLLDQLFRAAEIAHGFGIQVNAGHGLDYKNTQAILAMPHLVELNIGHAIVAEAVMVGMERAVQRMKEILIVRERTLKTAVGKK